MIPDRFRDDVAAFPAPLRALLDAELAAGNAIVDSGRGPPAPPGGAWARLARPLRTRLATFPARQHLARDTSRRGGGGGITDVDRRFFILEPATQLSAPAGPPDVRSAPPPAAFAPRANATDATRSEPPDTPLNRFRRSMQIGFDQWHDGIGYDLEALRAASLEERAAIEALLLSRAAADWRDVEALAALDTPRAREALMAAARHGSPAIRLAVQRHAPGLLNESERTAALVAALEVPELGDGLSAALDEAATYHPPEVVAALFRGALHGSGENAVHFAALLAYVHGQAAEPFDWDQRPFFLRFNTDNKAERVAVFRELCARIGVDGEDWLRPRFPAPKRKRTRDTRAPRCKPP